MSSSGLLFGGFQISLDDALSDLCFVSHAHSDHTAAFRKAGKTIIASEETFRIVGREPQPHPKIGGLSLFPAGHMLGARQLHAKLDGETFVYTGDFSLHDSYTAGSAPILSCDILMIDSTYCSPSMRLPQRGQVAEGIRRFVAGGEQSIIVFGAYQRGKSQELIALLNDECSVAPVVHEGIAKICEAYERCGVRLDYLQAGSEEAKEAMRHPFVAIMPPSKVSREFGSNLSAAFDRDVLTAVATGWAHISVFPVDKAFALSDHADFRDTMRYIYESGAKKIVCANSGSRAAALHLRRLGFNAIEKSELGAPQQTTLQECMAKK